MKKGIWKDKQLIKEYINEKCNTEEEKVELRNKLQQMSEYIAWNKKPCSACGKELPVTEFYKHKTSFQGKKSVCKKCDNKKKVKWCQEHREEHTAYNKKWSQEHREERTAYIKKWRHEHPEEWRKIGRKKEAKRRRELGYNELYENPFAKDVKVHWHHIDNENVVALPAWLHKMYYGKREYHREALKPYVEQIYGHAS